MHKAPHVFTMLPCLLLMYCFTIVKASKCLHVPTIFELDKSKSTTKHPESLYGYMSPQLKVNCAQTRIMCEDHKPKTIKYYCALPLSVGCEEGIYLDKNFDANENDENNTTVSHKAKTGIVTNLNTLGKKCVTKLIHCPAGKICGSPQQTASMKQTRVKGSKTIATMPTFEDPHDCPVGHFCFNNAMYNCADIANYFRMDNGQSLFDGMYCKKGLKELPLLSCKNDHQCLTPYESKKCNKGYICDIGTVRQTRKCEWYHLEDKLDANAAATTLKKSVKALALCGFPVTLIWLLYFIIIKIKRFLKPTVQQGTDAEEFDPDDLDKLKQTMIASLGVEDFIIFEDFNEDDNQMLFKFIKLLRNLKLMSQSHSAFEDSVPLDKDAVRRYLEKYLFMYVKCKIAYVMKYCDIDHNNYMNAQEQKRVINNIFKRDKALQVFGDLEEKMKSSTKKAFQDYFVSHIVPSAVSETATNPRIRAMHSDSISFILSPEFESGYGDRIAAFTPTENTTQSVVFSDTKTTKMVEAYAIQMCERLHSVDTAIESIRITLRDVSLFVPKIKRKVVKNVSVEIGPATSVAIMGGSGCGKTSLLNAICGKAYYGKVTGKVYLNGHEDSLSRHPRIMSFVPQVDTVHNTLTVKENLLFEGRLSSSATTSWTEIMRRTNRTMRTLLLSHIAETIVGGGEQSKGISGGQLKRVSIGISLMSGPSVLFLDEPTSGLDAAAVTIVCNSLKNLNTEGITVISVIHQPRFKVYQSFDQVILLREGQLVFSGAPNVAVSYLADRGHVMEKNVNPADFIIDCTSTQREGRKLIEAWKSKNETNKNFDVHPQPGERKLSYICAEMDEKSPWYDRIFVLFERGWIKRARSYNRILATLLAYETVVFLLIQIHGPFKKPKLFCRYDALFYMLLALTTGLICTMNSYVTFTRTKKIFFREIAEGLSPTYFAIAEMMLDTLCLALYSSMIAGVLWIGRHSVTLGFWYTVTFSYLWMVSSIAYITSIVGPSVSFSAIIFILPSLILTGIGDEKSAFAFINLYTPGSIIGKLCSCLTPSRWWFEEVLLSEMKTTEAQYFFTFTAGDLIQGLHTKLKSSKFVDNKFKLEKEYDKLMGLAMETSEYEDFQKDFKSCFRHTGIGFADFEAAETYNVDGSSPWTKGILIMFLFGLIYRCIAIILLGKKSRGRQTKKAAFHGWWYRVSSYCFGAKKTPSKEENLSKEDDNILSLQESGLSNTINDSSDSSQPLLQGLQGHKS